MRIKPIKEFNRALTPPPDKSITIRAVIMGWLSSGTTVIKNPLLSGDTIAAIDAVGELGAEVNFEKGNLIIKGGNFCSGTVDARNSATTMRLLAGAAAGLNIDVTINGDASLSKRNMRSLIAALSDMGAEIDSKNGFPPLTIHGRTLHGIDFAPTSPSAQIKSAVLLAGLNAEGQTTVREQIKTRPHTEDMLTSFGVDIINESSVITLKPSKLTGTEISVPGDMSSAAYPMVLGLNKGFCYLKNVGTARHEFIDFLFSIGADIEEEVFGDRANILVKKSTLKPFTISGALSAALIDELPLMAVLAANIKGESVITDAAALKNKECDRIKYTVSNLRNMGIEIVELADGFRIKGGNLKGGNAVTQGDHRIAMSMAVGNALSERGGSIDDDKCVEISYPSFWELFI